MCTSPNVPLLFSVGTLTCVEVVGTSAACQWAKTNNPLSVVITLVSFNLLGIVMAASIRKVDNMNAVNAAWQSTSIIAVSIVSSIVFEEVIPPRHVVGVVLAVLASLCFV